ncbi:uncharacterized protein LOC121415429 [Lytechinus variegatus]|uniref:uncharacterized protein LOC121415429 n=1 Tax=Lytechinus variegatus TaxID=7654 RepID=UPI001BB11E38|nr:uncharacterized protein LOC121415429 [Lytechinus variegatus]
MKEWPHLEQVAHELMPYNPSIKVSLLIGNNCPRAIRPREVIAGEDDPYAVRTALGWRVVGKVCQTSSGKAQICNRISAVVRYPRFPFTSKAKEIQDTAKMIQILEQDFRDSSSNGEPYSVEEEKFVEIPEGGIRRRDDGHYEMALPLKSPKFSLPFNGPLALKRWNQLPGRLQRNPKFGRDYREFINRRGTIRQLCSDQGTAFIGARSELKLALQEMDQQQVQEYLLENGVEWIPFKLNVPHSSHMGGVWERQIHTVRRALDTVLAKAGSQLDDEAFRTFMTEAECIVNSRPLTINDLSDSKVPEPLCPLHLLMMKPKVILPPTGKFQGADKYSRKWWRRVQYLANKVWLCWR